MRPDITPLAIPDVKLIRPARIGDARGWFSELFNRARLADEGLDFAPVQENASFNPDPGVLRGLHGQAPPSAQTKIVRAARGRIFDVAVDARTGSPTFGHWVGAELSAENGHQLYVPAGFLHGYITREPGCEVIYLVDAPYDPARELRVRWDDPNLGIDWSAPTAGPALSAADAGAPSWAAFQSPYRV